MLCTSLPGFICIFAFVPHHCNFGNRCLSFVHVIATMSVHLLFVDLVKSCLSHCLFASVCIPFGFVDLGKLCLAGSLSVFTFHSLCINFGKLRLACSLPAFVFHLLCADFWQIPLASGLSAFAFHSLFCGDIQIFCSRWLFASQFSYSLCIHSILGIFELLSGWCQCSYSLAFTLRQEYLIFSLAACQCSCSICPLSISGSFSFLFSSRQVFVCHYIHSLVLILRR